MTPIQKIEREYNERYKKAVIIILFALIMLQVYVNYQVAKIKPQLKEEYISLQTVELNGEKYVCGTEIKNQDNESLYCRGFTDGHNWAVQQIEIDIKLNDLIKK